MKNFINNIRADRLTFRGFVISFLFAILTAIFIVINYNNLPPFVSVFNQLPWGEQRLTSTIGIFIPIVVFSFIFVFNIIFTSIVYSMNPLIARIVAAVTLLISIMNFLFIVRTILIII